VVYIPESQPRQDSLSRTPRCQDTLNLCGPCGILPSRIPRCQDPLKPCGPCGILSNPSPYHVTVIPNLRLLIPNQPFPTHLPKPMRRCQVRDTRPSPNRISSRILLISCQRPSSCIKGVSLPVGCSLVPIQPFPTYLSFCCHHAQGSFQNYSR
jgi:hypothetical protein